MVAIDQYAVDARCQKLGKHRHGTTVSRDGGVVNLILVLIVVQVVDVQTAVLLAEEGALALGDGIHVGNDKQPYVPSVRVIDELAVEVGRVAADAVRVVALIVEYAVKNQRIDRFPGSSYSRCH